MRNLLVIFLIAMAMVGCSPGKRLTRLLDKHPELTNTEYRDTIIYRDSIVEIEIPGETVTEKIKWPVEINVPDTAIEAHTAFSYAKASLTSNELALLLVQTDTLILTRLDSVLVERIDTTTVFVEKIKQLPPKPLYKIGFWLFLVLFVIAWGIFAFFITRKK